ncbi:unnamed protein product [Caretta caretta]
MCGRSRAFYAGIFSPDLTDPNACRVLWDELPMVSPGDRDWLELPLTLAEFSEALHCMPTNKSPGIDGLTTEFYRMFWDVLGPDLVTVWAKSLQSGVLPLSYMQPPRFTKLASSFTPQHRLQGRTILDNLYLVQDLLELGCRDGLLFALLSLDQEKAFDRVDHEYLLSTLQMFDFRPQFVGFLWVLYASTECLVRLNWILTEPVCFGQGVQQGCPLSGQLYTLAMEPFLCLLHRRLTGLVLQEPELRLVLSAYADDMLLVVQDLGDLARVEVCQAIYSAAGSTGSRAVASWLGTAGKRSPSHPCFRPSGGAQVHCSISAFTFLPRIRLHRRTGMV